MHLSLADHRSHVGIVEAAAQPDRPDAFCQHVDKAIMGRALEQQSGRRGAGLRGVLHQRAGRGRCGALQVGVAEDQVGGFATELERHRHDVVRGRLHDRDAGGNRPGEGDVVDAGMRCQRGSGFPATGHHVEDAGRNTRLNGKLGQPHNA